MIVMIKELTMMVAVGWYGLIYKGPFPHHKMDVDILCFKQDS